PTGEAAPQAKLRLKPKLSASEPAETPPKESAGTPSPEEVVAPAAPRLKPRLVADTPQAAPSPIEPSPAIAPPPPSPTPAAAELPPAPPAEPPKFKLKIKPPEPAASSPAAPNPVAAPPVLSEAPVPPALAPAAPPPPPPPPVARKPNTPPPFPVVAESGKPDKKPLPPPVPHVRAPLNSIGADHELPPPTRRPRGGRGKPLLLGGAVLLLAVAAAAYYLLMAEPEPPPPPLAIKKPAPASSVAKPTPSDTLNQVAALPGQAIGKAQDVVNARRANEQARVDALVAGEEVPEARAFGPQPNAAPKTAQNTPPPITSTSQLAPGLTATTTSEDIAVAASPAFRIWVANAKINGVFQGTPARALINGRTFRAGQEVEETLGISFDTVDTEAKTIVFRDRTGATVARRY
ncbi:MAG TPA: hypothetical protein VEQ65_13375, partial [Opitutus sp.]|nr:hypothetical protein [Opitutus sp.]